MDNEFMRCNSPSNASPSQGRTMKDYEEQLGGLRKENFNLKLKIYFLEERLDATNTPNSQDDILKKNIELKVSLEGLRKEVSEHQELLCVAARALELMEASAARKESELLSQISKLEDEIQVLRDATNVDMSKMEGNSIAPDDSVALFTAAFNAPKPQISEILKNKLRKTNNVCECRQLRALLTAERETTATLRNVISSHEKEPSEIQQNSETINTHQLESETDIEGISETTSKQLNIDKELEKLRQENLNACQMIQGCLVRIQQMDKENKKLKTNLKKKENLLEQDEDDSADIKTKLLKKYKEMIDTRDNKITMLENQLIAKTGAKDLSNSKNSSQTEETDWNWINSHLERKIDTLRESICNPEKICKDVDVAADKESDQKNLLHILTSRLQEMAFFLDSLLSNRCILGEDKRRKVENLLEQSLELPVGLKLDPSASQLLEDTCIDFLPNNASLKLADLTKLFGHHLILDDTVTSHQGVDIISPTNENKVIGNKNLYAKLQLQQQEMENLRSQLNCVKERCICGSIGEDSEEKTDANIKSTVFEYNRLILKKSKSKANKINKTNLNTTWHGYEGFRADQSESECWSEPDRNVSLARMGGPLEVANLKESASSEDEICQCRKTHTQDSQNARQSISYSDENNRLSYYKCQIEILKNEKNKIEKNLEEANATITSLETKNNQHIVSLKQKDEEIKNLTKKLDDTESSLEKFSLQYTKTIEHLRSEKISIEEKLKVVEKSVCELEESHAKEQQQFNQEKKVMQIEIKEITDTCNMKIKEMKDNIESDWVSRVRYEALRRDLDNAALQASQATLDRTLAAEQKMRSDIEAERLRLLLAEAKLRINDLENINSDLQNRFVHMESWHNSLNRTLPFPNNSLDIDSPQRATSPDQGIDSDRLSSLELAEPASSRDDYVPTTDLSTENTLLRERLERTQRTLENTLNQLHAADYRKKKMQRAMCQEIHKTHTVLRQVRDNLTYDSCACSLAKRTK